MLRGPIFLESEALEMYTSGEVPPPTDGTIPPPNTDELPGTFPPGTIPITPGGTDPTQVPYGDGAPGQVPYDPSKGVIQSLLCDESVDCRTATTPFTTTSAYTAAATGTGAGSGTPAPADSGAGIGKVLLIAGGLGLAWWLFSGGGAALNGPADAPATELNGPRRKSRLKKAGKKHHASLTI